MVAVPGKEEEEQAVASSSRPPSFSSKIAPGFGKEENISTTELPATGRSIDFGVHRGRQRIDFWPMAQKSVKYTREDVFPKLP